MGVVVIGMAGIEPAASAPPERRATSTLHPAPKQTVGLEPTQRGWRPRALPLGDACIVVISCREHKYYMRPEGFEPPCSSP